MLEPQKPIVGIGTQFPAGRVVAIRKDGILLDTHNGVKLVSFSDVERFVQDDE